MEKMKNIIKWYPVIVILSITCTYCTKSDEYKKYMPDGEIIYPQKADSVKTFPGRNRIQLEWIIVDPKVTSCKVFYEQGGIQGSTTVARNTGGNDISDTIRVIIPDLEETNYCAFKIVSYDDFGHASIPVETEETVYGEMYESSLLNRMLKSTSFNESEGLRLEWYEADATETGININYTDINGTNRTITVAASETSTVIPDFKITEPIYYSTMYLPVPSAIDVFHARVIEERIPYYANITHLLNNPGDPFILGNMVHDNRFYEAVGWIANAVAAVNGNIDNFKGAGYSLSMLTWAGYSPSPSITNGKLYQTVELEAGVYKFDAALYTTSDGVSRAYVVAALGNDLPDVDNVAQETFSFMPVPAGIEASAASKPVLSVEFTLSRKSFVSLGFVANIASNQEMLIRRVELWEKR